MSAKNPRRVFPRYTTNVNNKAKGIDNFVRQHTIENISWNPRKVETLSSLQADLRAQFWHMEAAWDSMRANLPTADPDFTLVEEWVNAAQVIMNKALEDLDAFLEVKEASAWVADALVATNQEAMNQAGTNQAGEIQQVPVLAQGNVMDVVPHAKSLTG